ncbi:MAG TPA: hypothetical protein VM658_10100 [bacterium]|nr:hypothetical protein [bacterium]
MFNEHVELVDIDPNHWVNLTKLVSGELLRKESSGPRKPKPASLSLLMENGRVLKAGHSRRGPLQDYSPDLSDLAALAQREEVEKVSVVERGTPRRIMHQVQSSLSLDMNFLEQILTIYSAIRSEMGHGIRLHPRPRMPDLKPGAVSTILKAVLASRELLVMVVYSDDGKLRDSSGLPIVTSGIVRINDKAELDLITTTDSLIAAGLSFTDWREGVKRVNELAEKVWKSKVFLGVHIPLSAMPSLVRAAMKNEGPKALSAMNKSGELILDPFPLRVRALLKMGGLMRGI